MVTPAAEELTGLLGQLLDPNIHFPERPVFVPDLDVFEMPDGLGFQFRGTEAPIILRGKAVTAVVEYLRATLDGNVTREQLIAKPPDGVGPSAFVRALLLLHTKGLLASADEERLSRLPAIQDTTLDRQLLFWGRHLGITRAASSGTEVQRRLAKARVVLFGGGLFGAITGDLLARTGFGNIQVLAWNDDGPMQHANKVGFPSVREFRHLPTTAFDPALLTLREWLAAADLLITATCDAPTALFISINDIAINARTAWLRGNSDGAALDIGPLVQPYETACFACLSLREQSAREFAFEHEHYEERLETAREASERILVGEAVWPATLGASLLVGEAFRFITGLAASTLTNAVLRVLPVTGKFESNRFIRTPRCPACYRGTISAFDLARL
jgi:bacteriocin biosynthesis cyclodehydratase domain-containing protein